MTAHDSLLQRLETERVEAASDADLVRLVADLWADLEARSLLAGSRDFLLERIQFYGRRGFLTARERQGIIHTLLGSAVPYRQRLQSFANGRAVS